MRVTRVGPRSSFSSPGIETAESRACDKKAQIAVPQNWNGPQRPGNTLATSPAPSLFANCFCKPVPYRCTLASCIQKRK